MDCRHLNQRVRRVVALGTLLCSLASLGAEQTGTEEEKAARAGKDFAKSNSVSIVLGKEREYDGLKHSGQWKDGLTKITTIDGEPCRYLNLLGQRAEAYLYFSIDPGFKRTNAQNVRVDVEYFDVVFDESPVHFSIHYDASKNTTGASSRYLKAPQSVYLRGSNAWQTASFHLRRASFANSQNAQSDFRLVVTPPELYVRKVTVTRETNPSSSGAGF